MTDPKKPKRKPANENPWYILATIHGEQGEDSIDWELAARNRETWNRYYANQIPQEEHMTLIKRGYNPQDLKPFNSEELSEIYLKFEKRNKNTEIEIPDPNLFINFSRIEFTKCIIFKDYWFGFGISFDNSVLAQINYFDNATFSGYFSFKRAKFGKTNLFRRVKFDGMAFFDNVICGGWISFDAATFSDRTHFDKSIFIGGISFKGSKFQAGLTFNSTIFRAYVPDFRDATLPEALEFDGAQWPAPPPDRLVQADIGAIRKHDNDAYAQIHAYERLKQEMERQKKHHEELDFFAREMRARRALSPRFSLDWCLNALYGGSCDYGQSLTRPLCALFVLFLYGAIALFSVPLKDGTLIPYGTAHALSLANLIPFIPIRKEAFGEAWLQDLPPLIHAIGIVQTLLALLCLFLLGLGLRNRFRLR